MVASIAVLALTASVALQAFPSDPALPASLQRFRSIRDFVFDRGDALWPGFGRAPFDALFISPSNERLYCRATLPDGFIVAGRDPITGCSSGIRPRGSLPAGLLAAMPVFGPPSTIVMGTPQATGRSDADWTRTILHEHFHQWQDALPGFYGRVAKLDLSDGDETGMWMLNFPFPYAEAHTVAALGAASRSLANALDARGHLNFRAKLQAYLIKRRALARTVGTRNWRYAELELWKEGVARWTEIQLGKRFPDAAVQASAVKLEQRSRDWLDTPDIAAAGREFVYPFGASEAMLLEACGPAWRRAYPSQLALGPLLERAARRCRS
ncbi:hypothetical protein, partial [Sphingomonas sp.]|uniref:hypothetical protein n=1 Tax=Sphingomonas sp. TaxID=28214 RepID=UPI0025DE43D2